MSNDSWTDEDELDLLNRLRRKREVEEAKRQAARALLRPLVASISISGAVDALINNAKDVRDALAPFDNRRGQ